MKRPIQKRYRVIRHVRLRQWVRAAHNRLRRIGEEVSAGSWWADGDNSRGDIGACIFSVRSLGPSTYNHPAREFMIYAERIVTYLPGTP